MKHDITSLLDEVLDIIGYSTNKEMFIKQFQEAILLETILNVYEQLPKETQQRIKASDNNSEKMKQYIPHDMYKEELRKVTYEAISNFVTSVSIQLVPLQKKRIAELLESQ